MIQSDTVHELAVCDCTFKNVLHFVFNIGLFVSVKNRCFKLLCMFSTVLDTSFYYMYVIHIFYIVDCDMHCIT